MTHLSPAHLPDMAALFATMAADDTGRVGERERQEIHDVLSELFPEIDERTRQSALVSTIASIPVTSEGRTLLLHHIATTLQAHMDTETGTHVVNNLRAIAGSDGIITGSERDKASLVADAWGLTVSAMKQPLSVSDDASPEWSAAHDLALVYLGLAHGVDDDLSRSEVNAIVRMLQRWLPDLEASEAAVVLRDAMERYVAGPRDVLVDQAVSSLRDVLSVEQRRDALADLIRIANADGVFLDNEEDLIVRLQDDWDVDPDALYD